MYPLTIYREDIPTSTVISNIFIDEYMTEANDAEIKVYLYLMRMVSANLPTSVSDMADRFNHTEKDILRALKYWEKKNLFSLEYNESKVLTGIHFKKGEVPHMEEKETKPLGQIVPMKLSSEVEEVKPMEFDEKITYSRDQIKEFKNNPETSQILFVAESYLKKILNTGDVETLIFMSKELKFSCELIDYLLQYCIERDKKNLSYIKAVAIDWAKHGIKDVKQAKAYLKSFESTNKKPQAKTITKNSFNQFKQTDYDFEELEKQLLSQ